MTLRWVTSLAEMEALQPRWNALWDQCPRATPFQSADWIIPWTRHLFGGGEIHVGVMEADGELIALAPFFLYGIEERTLAFLGAGISDYGDVLVRPGRESECAEMVRQWIAQQEIRCDLREVPQGSALLTGGESECSVCPVLLLSELDTRLDPKLRHDLKRARNRLEKQHLFSFDRATEETAAEYLDALFRLHEARWKQEQQAGVLNSAALRAFHAAASRAFLHRGLLRLYVLRVDGEIRAAIYGFVAGARFYSYLSGFDPAYARLSCGALLIRHVVDEAAAQQLTEFDFLRQPEAYKYAWGARDRPNYLFDGNTTRSSGGAASVVATDIATITP